MPKLASSMHLRTRLLLRTGLVDLATCETFRITQILGQL